MSFGGFKGYFGAKNHRQKSLFTNKKGVSIYNDLKKVQKQQMQSKKPLRMPFCLYGVSMLFATL
ncbi:hypothetical protein Taiwan902_14420 [Helicobacter pylori]